MIVLLLGDIFCSVKHLGDVKALVCGKLSWSHLLWRFYPLQALYSNLSACFSSTPAGHFSRGACVLENKKTKHRISKNKVKYQCWKLCQLSHNKIWLTFCLLCLVNLLIVSHCLFILLCVHIAAAEYAQVCYCFFNQFEQYNIVADTDNDSLVFVHVWKPKTNQLTVSINDQVRKPGHTTVLSVNRPWCRSHPV